MTALSLGPGLAAAAGRRGPKAGTRPPLSPPALLRALPNLVLPQASGTHVVTVFPHFSGTGLTFSVTGPGAAIDPATGALTLSTDRLAQGFDLIVTAANAAGFIESRFRVSVVARAEAVTAPPVRITGPALSGTGRLGEPVTVDPGVWTPAEVVLGLRWQRDGTEIPGAVGAVYVPVAADARTALTCVVTAVTESGRVEAVTAPLAIATVALAAPVAAGRLDALTRIQGSGPATVAAGADFTGADLVFAVTGAGAAIDAATGLVTLSTEAVLFEEPVVVTAANAAGAASSVLRLSVTPVRAPLSVPVTTGRLEDLTLTLAPGARTVSAQAVFAGEKLVYDLVRAPAGVTIHPGSGLVRIPTDAARPAQTITVRARNAAGDARTEFAVTVRAVASVFDAPARLADVDFVFDAAPPAWTHAPEGHARLTPAGKGRAHGAWSGAAGDGRYRCLARWSNPILAGLASARPFSFTARLTRSGQDFAGLRIDAVQPVPGRGDLEILEYTGAGIATRRLAGTTVGWAWDVWTWIEVDLDGAEVRARLYGETAEPPAWQVTAPTAVLAPGAQGPGGMPRFMHSPHIDIRRLEFQPRGVVPENVPPAALDADWSLGQFTEQK